MLDYFSLFPIVELSHVISWTNFYTESGIKRKRVKSLSQLKKLLLRLDLQIKKHAVPFNGWDSHVLVIIAG